MNQEYDREIDSLLRRSARLAAGPKSAATTRAPFASSHLDADELSAFAENALPSAARLAAASHLADCDECRGTVVRLTSAADTAGEIEKRAATVPVVPIEVPWWKTLLGGFFAPRVMRYAAPVLVLGLVGVVSFIALRTRQGSVPATVYQEEAARDASTAAPPGLLGENATTGTTADTSTTANANTTMPNNASPVAGPGGVVAPAAPKPEQQPGVNQPAPVVADKDDAPADRAAAVAGEKKAGPVSEVTAEREDRDALSANTVAAPPPPPAKAAVSEVTEQPKGARGADLSRSKEKEPEEQYVYNERAQQEQNRAATQMRNRQESQMPDGSARNDSRAANSRGNLGGTYTPPASKAERPATRRGRTEDGKARDSQSEDDEVARVDAQRSVGGRRFRREGGAWVDVNYKPSMSMTAVRRGTDGYRALVTDIPELGRIAEQLGGEVIAVVKGRAYRIR